MNNLRNWKSESFILNHWMVSHSLRTGPPEFEFRVVSKHQDALSRQISEAVLIRSRGESKKYSWVSEAEYRSAKRAEKEHEEKLNNFVHVMKNVLNVTNKRKVA